MCDEFHCLPSEAIRELNRCESLVFDILEARAYAKAKQACDEADANNVESDKYPKGPMVDMVLAIELDIHRARFADDGE